MWIKMERIEKMNYRYVLWYISMRKGPIMSCSTGKISFNYDTFITSFEVVSEMMEDRGYCVFERIINNREEFEEKLKESGYISTTAIHSSGYNCFITWFPFVEEDIKKLTAKNIVDLRNFAKESGKNRILIITDRDITINASKIIGSDGDFFEIKRFVETQFNITKHNFAPQYRALSKDEIEELIKLYGTLDKFPRIFDTDPISRYYMWKIGTVVEIIRSNYNGPSVYYRVVSKG